MAKPSSQAVADKSVKSPSFLIKSYLVLYNALCIIGWGLVDFHIINHFLVNGFNHPERLWPVVEMPLKIVQTAAVLEVFHAAFGFVRSPVFVTFVQGE
jgi:very-long-chain (3R)-3-hydroxyacyl-CoA dehydratase